MIPSKKFPLIASLVVAALAPLPLPASEKTDLTRDTPVPANEPIPVQDFVREPIIQQPILNPSGTHVAAIVSSTGDHSALIVYNLQTSQLEPLDARDVDSDVDWVAWLGNDRVGFRISVHKAGGLVFGSARVGAIQATAHPVLQGFGGDIVAIPPGDRQHPLVYLAPDGFATGRYGQVISVNAGYESGHMLDLSALTRKNLDDAREFNIRHISKRYPVLETPDGFQLYYLADKEGQLAYGVTSTNGINKLHQLSGESWSTCPEDLDEISVMGCSDNPGEIVVLGQRQEGKPRQLQVMKAATGEVVDRLVQDKAFDANAWLYRDPVSHNIVGAIYDRGASHVVWFSEAYRALQKMVDGLFPGQIVRIIGNDEKGKMVLISTYSDRQSPFYRWVDLEKRKVGDIRQSRPWIDSKRMQPMSSIKYSTRDGRELDAFVVMPAGATKENRPPLIVLPPEGTWSHHSWGFNRDAQFFASRGYAVLLPNHRGSAGTTWMFPTSDEWAFRKMHDDVTQATKAMVATGLVDPNRIAIVGTEFAGYLALSGVAYEPSLYRCAVAVSAVTDWGKYIAEDKYFKFDSSFYSRMVYKLGDPAQNPQKWDAIAPLRHASEIRGAVFVATGEYDSPLVISGSKDLASAVERNHVPVETVTFLNESFGVRHIDHKVELYSRIEAFLAKNLGAGITVASIGSP